MVFLKGSSKLFFGFIFGLWVFSSFCSKCSFFSRDFSKKISPPHESEFVLPFVVAVYVPFSLFYGISFGKWGSIL